MTITVGCPQTNRKTDTGKTLKRWPVLVDHYSIEMVRRYAHLAPNHLTEHAKQIDSIFGLDVPNMSHSGNQEEVKEA